jgi:hypothetical protein
MHAKKRTHALYKEPLLTLRTGAQDRQEMSKVTACNIHGTGDTEALDVWEADGVVEAVGDGSAPKEMDAVGD